MEMTEIGRVRSSFSRPANPFEMKKTNSSLKIYPEYAAGLLRIEECDLIQVVFGFHLSEGYDLQHNNYRGEYKGVFAACSPRRPSPVGPTTVKLLEVKQNILHVQGLDAFDNTPVFDLKPFVPFQD